MSVIQFVSQKVQDVDTGIIGKAALGVSGTGTALQWITQFGSVALVILNVILALGGIYLVILKIAQQRAQHKMTKRERPINNGE